jgi:2-aminoadipate transaminase
MLTHQAPYRFSQRSSYLERSVMRDLLKHAVDPNIISLAGGLPASECLPLAQLKDCMNTVLERDGTAALQYAPPYVPLRQWIADYMNRRGVACDVSNIFITNGNQQALTILSRLFLDMGDYAVIEDAVFTGVQQGTKGIGAKVLSIPTHLQTGADVDELEDLLQQYDVRMVVLIPDFHNPLGVSMSESKRRYVVELAERYAVPVVEDDAYSPLRFSGETLKPIRAYDESGYVFYIGSFSKMLAPGLRLGWMVIPDELMAKVTVIRESIDLETSTLTQRTVHEFLSRGLLDAHLQQLNAEHQIRANALMNALDTHLADIAAWTQPEGGLFAWAELPEELNTWEMLPEAIANGVVYIPGGAFATHGGKLNCLRLNFSNVKPEKFDEGLRRLRQVIQKHL